MAGGKYHTWVASVMPSSSHVLTHLSHRHPLRWTALQENFMVQGHFLAQRLLIKVLAQVWEKGKGSMAPSGQGREEASQAELDPEVPHSSHEVAVDTKEISPGLLAVKGSLFSKMGTSPGGLRGTKFPP